MYESCTEIGEVRYNPATASFEALVTVPTPEGNLRMPSSFEAPLDTEYEAAVSGLKARAIASLDRPDRLAARTKPSAADVPPETPRFPPMSRLFDAFFGNRAA